MENKSNELVAQTKITRALALKDFGATIKVMDRQVDAFTLRTAQTFIARASLRLYSADPRLLAAVAGAMAISEKR